MNLKQITLDDTDHHDPRSLKIIEALKLIDSEFSEGYFDWKTGGDGDNGEELLIQLDIYFKALDLGLL